MPGPAESPAEKIIRYDGQWYASPNSGTRGLQGCKKISILEAKGDAVNDNDEKFPAGLPRSKNARKTACEDTKAANGAKSKRMNP
ncbi:hypothetical protein [Mycobacterium simiae]|uniref:hypothetical protein n=1 Tax=Mycobacterium simiae TaxID=1784 RepID=UPI00041AB50F|nr:hypothetical protein [Mycobacterium simiae]PLV47664.1 hypothetical protein X011_19230 [Mycobacterium tuberculosis variant microti OV254]BBX41724.1 hypothetical protein MSIM_31750 [Mycobacterium simiae]